MNKFFLLYNEHVYTYEQLLEDLREKNSWSSYVYVTENQPYKIFLAIIHSLVYDYPIELLDGDFSEIELDDLGISQESLKKEKKVIGNINFQDLKEVMKRMTETRSWKLSLYTSGTTGRPKKVDHTFKTLTRNVKQHSKLEDDIWAFAYNPTHMAGLQVFFQAFLNQNSLVYVFGKSMKAIPKLLVEKQVTHISATSTFYRNLIPYLQGNEYLDVKKATFGGEKYDVLLEEKLNNVFPNAKLVNIYASTEIGSLFTAHGDIFEILHEQRQSVQISAENELCIHHSLLGKSASIPLVDGWFHTGDLVEMVDEVHFKFLSRQSDMINVGGYKVNPLEVENLLVRLPGVVDVLAKSKKNSVTGELLVVDVVKSDTVDRQDLKKEIKQYAAAHLQEWKVPRIIKFVDEIPKTRTGKKARR